MSQEQSSILTPKNDLIGVKKTKKVTNESTKLPQPTGWRLLILPFFQLQFELPIYKYLKFHHL